MSQHFSCRNHHRWALSLEGAAINERWVYCPACGAPPRPGTPLTRWQSLGRWMRRNPAILALLASVVVMLVAFGVIAKRAWDDRRARHEAEQGVIRALGEARTAIERFQLEREPEE